MYATQKSKHEKLEAAQKELLQVKSGKDSGVYKELEKAYQKDIHEPVIYKIYILFCIFSHVWLVCGK